MKVSLERNVKLTFFKASPLPCNVKVFLCTIFYIGVMICDENIMNSKQI